MKAGSFFKKVTQSMVVVLLLLHDYCSAFAGTFAEDFVGAALERTKHFIIYNGTYFNIDYPNGDVPARFGVCTDVIIRSYRALGTDLQVLVHEDMAANFDQYPSKKSGA